MKVSKTGGDQNSGVTAEQSSKLDGNLHLTAAREKGTLEEKKEGETGRAFRLTQRED